MERVKIILSTTVLTMKHLHMARKSMAIFSLIICLSMLLSPLGVRPAYAINPAPVMLFYVTLPEDDALTVLDTINTAATSPIVTYFSIAIATTGTYVYYDQWEDGYAADIANPTVGEIYSDPGNLDGVQIWGNSNCADGFPPNKNGTAITLANCTAAPGTVDNLVAGDVIIPSNDVPVPREVFNTYVLDNFGTVAYNNNNGNTNWSGDWVETGDIITANYHDAFNSQSYNLSTGSLDWTGQSWTEENDDGSASAGTIYINTGSSELRFIQNSVANDAIKRTANLSGYLSATLSFVLDGSNIDASPDDDIKVQISSDGGSNWTDLATFSSANDPGGGTVSYDITSYIASNTTVRFIMVGNLETTGFGDGERWDIDDVDITVGTAGTSPSAGDIQITGGQLRFTATETNDSIDRGVNLSSGDACTTLSFSLGQNGIDAAEDRLDVQISSDGTTYTTLETFDNPADAGSKSYNISAYATANTRVRFKSIDQLEAGEYWTFDDVQIAWNCSIPPLFDGRDKVGASSSIAMARATWASGSGTLNAFGHEMYSTAEWGTVYEAPVGTNTTNAGSMFEYSALSIMASQNNTLVDIDTNGDGTFEVNDYALDEGETVPLDLVDNISQGARVVADKPVQVVLVTGDINSNYASRDMNLLPTSAYGSSYWSPVGVSNGTNLTRLYLYNPSTNGSIYISCERRSATTITYGPIAPRGVVTHDLTDYQAEHCYASTSNGTATSSPIFAVGTVDTTGSSYDWSFTLFPDNFLTTEALVGLGLGRDPTYNGTSNNENAGPLWVTPACTSGTFVYVDWNNDGTAELVDLNGDGDTTDTIDGIAESTTANGISIAYLQSVRLFEPGSDSEPYDQTGARVWSRTASGVGKGGTPGCNLALAWGEDPGPASAGSPGLDVGTSIPPLRLLEGTKSLVLKTDNDGDGLLGPGDVATYNITLKNSSSLPVNNVYVYDNVPTNTTYVPSTTEKDLTSNAGTGPWVSIPDDGSGTAFPLDESPASPPDGVLLGNIAAGAIWYVRFDVTLTASVDYIEINNCETSYTDFIDIVRCTNNPVFTKDWADLPDTYGTLLSSNGARHVLFQDTNGDGKPDSAGVNPAIWLGTNIDRELNGQPNASASGDDSVGAIPDDETGIALTKFFGYGLLEIQATCTSSSGTPQARLVVWFDWNSGGSFDSSEAFINQLVNCSTAGTTTTIQYNFTGPKPNTLAYRARLFESTFGQTTAASTFIGSYTNGEVEDYLFLPTAVTVTAPAATGLAQAIQVDWETYDEQLITGFEVYRAETPDGDQTLVCQLPADHPGSAPPDPFDYGCTDGNGVQLGVTYYYWLKVITTGGSTTLGPTSASPGLKFFIPSLMR